MPKRKTKKRASRKSLQFDVNKFIDYLSIGLVVFFGILVLTNSFAVGGGSSEYVVKKAPEAAVPAVYEKSVNDEVASDEMAYQYSEMVGSLDEQIVAMQDGAEDAYRQQFLADNEEGESVFVATNTGVEDEVKAESANDNEDQKGMSVGVHVLPAGSQTPKIADKPKKIGSEDQKGMSVGVHVLAADSKPVVKKASKVKDIEGDDKKRLFIGVSVLSADE